MKSFKPTIAMLVGAAAAVVFVVAYSWLAWSAPRRFTSPDENSNYVFSRLYAERNELTVAEPLNRLVPGLVRPRSVVAVGERLVPGGFLGLPVIYGSLAKLVGVGAIPYLTALVAVLAAVALGAIMSRLFGRTTGRLAAVLLLIQPVWWYESSRLLYPNILFCSLTLLAAACLVAAPFLSRAPACAAGRACPLAWLDGVPAGFFLALAVVVRPAEIYWLALAALPVAILAWRRLPWPRLLAAAATVLIVILPFVFLNRTVYGSWFATGYGSGLAAVEDLPQGFGAQLIGPLQPWLFPLGFAPRTAFRQFLTFGLGLFSWWWLIVAAAFGYWLRRLWLDRRADTQLGGPISPGRIFAVSAFAVSIWLILFYGSYRLQDNPDPLAVTVGTSYLRYWLPIFVLSVVPVAWALDRLTRPLCVKLKWGALIGVLAIIGAISAWSVFTAPQEGLLALRQNQFRYDAAARAVLERTELEAVIVVDRADKLLWPERAVIQPLRQDATYVALGRLAGERPLYYFGITLPLTDLSWWRQTKLPPLGLTVDPVLTVDGETLYVFSPLPRD